MIETENLTSLNVDEVSEIRLSMTGLFNWDKYKVLETVEVENIIVNDIKRRITEWVEKKFKEEPFTGVIFVKAFYTALDYHYTSKEVVSIKFRCDFENNVLFSIKALSSNFDKVKITYGRVCN